MKDDLYIAKINRLDGKTEHILCYLQPINCAAAYEYHDPITDEVVGSVGRNHLLSSTRPVGADVEYAVLNAMREINGQ